METSASVVRIETAEVGNKLSLVEVEVTSGVGANLPNRAFTFASLIPSTVSGFLSVPENNSSNTITVLGTPDTVAPDGIERLQLLGDPYLSTGVFNPSASSPGVQVTFAEPLINGPGEELLVFELSIGSGQTPDPIRVSQVGGTGLVRNVPSSHYQMQGVIPASAAPNTFLSLVENGGATDLAELTTTELTNFGAVASPKWHVMPIDLDWLGVPAWQSLSTLEIVSADGSRAADLLMVVGLRSVTPPGDYDLDLDVDGGDFLQWQRQFGTTEGAADGNGDGFVDAADLDVWRNRYGYDGVARAAAVPEPALSALLGIPLGAFGLAKRGRQKMRNEMLSR